MNKRIIVHFVGHVQGVGFRYGAVQIAAGFEVLGSVENLPDGGVKLIAEGIEGELEQFMKEIGDSHLRAHFRQAEVEWTEATGGLSGFKIKR